MKYTSSFLEQLLAMNINKIVLSAMVGFKRTEEEGIDLP